MLVGRLAVYVVCSARSPAREEDSQPRVEGAIREGLSSLLLSLLLLVVVLFVLLLLLLLLLIIIIISSSNSSSSSSSSSSSTRGRHNSQGPQLSGGPEDSL